MTSPATEPKTLNELAQLLQGTVHGDGDTSVTQLVHPKFISDPSDLALIISPEAIAALRYFSGVVKAAIVDEEIDIPEGLLKGYIKVRRPKVALAILLNVFNKPPYHTEGVHPTAIIDESAQVEPTAHVGAYSIIGPRSQIGKDTVISSHVTIGADVAIGNNNLIYPGVRIGDRCKLGNQVIVHNNCSIGADGFSYVTPEKGSIESARESGGKIEAQNTEIIKINSVGNVVIEDNVEIGACSTIDRGNLGPTLVKKGTKIDNLVMIGHNNTVGENCLIVSQVGISGSCTIGNRVVLAGQVGIKDHTTIGDDAICMAKAGVIGDIESKAIVVGQPARPQRETLHQLALVSKLGDMRKELKELQKRVRELEAGSPQRSDTEVAKV